MPVLYKIINLRYEAGIAVPSSISLHEIPEECFDKCLSFVSFANSLGCMVNGNSNVVSEPMVLTVAKINQSQLVPMKQKIPMMQIAMNQTKFIFGSRETKKVILVLLPLLR
ncbi:hypothetical protein D3C81_1678340 [compost metagenome]